MLLLPPSGAVPAYVAIAQVQRLCQRCRLGHHF